MRIKIIDREELFFGLFILSISISIIMIGILIMYTLTDIIAFLIVGGVIIGSVGVSIMIYIYIIKGSVDIIHAKRG